MIQIGTWYTEYNTIWWFLLNQPTIDIIVWSQVPPNEENKDGRNAYIYLKYHFVGKLKMSCLNQESYEIMAWTTYNKETHQ